MMQGLRILQAAIRQGTRRPCGQSRTRIVGRSSGDALEAGTTKFFDPGLGRVTLVQSFRSVNRSCGMKPKRGLISFREATIARRNRESSPTGPTELLTRLEENTTVQRTRFAVESNFVCRKSRLVCRQTRLVGATEIEPVTSQTEARSRAIGRPDYLWDPGGAISGLLFSS